MQCHRGHFKMYPKKVTKIYLEHLKKSRKLAIFENYYLQNQFRHVYQGLIGKSKKPWITL